MNNTHHQKSKELNRFSRKRLSSCTNIQRWNNAQQQEKLYKVTIEDPKESNIIFVSPIPYLLSLFSATIGYGQCGYDGGIPARGGNKNLYIFHNDNREKKGLIDGKVVSVVDKTGWKLFKIEVPKISNLQDSEHFSQ